MVDVQSGGEAWGNRAMFVLACIGSAVGLGNVWRFPYLCYRWGGAAWFIPYGCALIGLGIPLLSLEIGIGQVFRKGSTGGYGTLAPRFRGLGVSGGLVSMIILGYYCAILSWALVYLVESFNADLPWSIRPDPNIPPAEILAKPTGHFFGDTLHITDGPLQSEYIVGKLFAAAAVQWFLNWVLLVIGIESTGKAIYFVVGFPFVMVFVLLGRGVSLEGASLGITNYIGRFDGSNLSNGQMWVQAVGQCFFSLSLAGGSMSAYASYQASNQNAVQNSVIIGFSDMGFSFVAGFSVFSVIGYIATQMGIDDISKVPRLAGTGLAFITYPSSLSTFSGAWANFFCVCFFIMLFLLGTSSAIALVEGFGTNLRMAGPFQHIERNTMTTVVCICGFLTTCLYVSDAGLYWLDIIDYYTNTYNLQIIGFFQCLTVGWAHGAGRIKEQVGATNFNLYAFGMFGGWIAFIIASLASQQDTGISFLIGLACFVGIAGPCCFIAVKNGAAVMAANGSSQPMKDSAWALGMMGPNLVREKFNSVITEGAPNNWQYPMVWAWMMKYFVPGVLMLLIGINLKSLATTPGGYEGYPWGAQIVGILIALIDLIPFFIGLVRPDILAEKHVETAEDDNRQEVTVTNTLNAQYSGVDKK